MCVILPSGNSIPPLPIIFPLLATICLHLSKWHPYCRFWWGGLVIDASLILDILLDVFHVQEVACCWMAVCLFGDISWWGLSYPMLVSLGECLLLVTYTFELAVGQGVPLASSASRCVSGHLWLHSNAIEFSYILIKIIMRSISVWGSIYLRRFIGMQGFYDNLRRKIRIHCAGFGVKNSGGGVGVKHQFVRV